MIGFTAGAGVLIALNQLRKVMGVSFADGVKPTISYEVAIETFRQIGSTQLQPLAIGTFTALLVVVLPKIHRRLPGALLAIVLASLACYLLGWHETVMIVRNIEQGIQGSLDIFHLPRHVIAPDFQLTRDYAAGALAMAVLGLIEATSISRTIARASEQRLDFNKEFLGQGVSKIAGSFFSCFAGSGSFTRTALNFKAGGHTRMSAVFSAAGPR